VRKLTEIKQRLEVHCPYVRALEYVDRYLSHLGWSDRSHVVTLRLRVPLGASDAGKGLALDKEVIASLDRLPQPRRLEERIAVTWEPQDAHEPFPKFDGTLSLEAASPKACFLTLEGKYEPPLGVAGKVFDAALGRRIAEATARLLLKEIGDWIELGFVQDEPHLSQ
jgi:hypothetical protein